MEAISLYCQAKPGCYRKQQYKEKEAKEQKKGDLGEISEPAVKRALEMGTTYNVISIQVSYSSWVSGPISKLHLTRKLIWLLSI